jgi:hypothetical protein
MNVQPDPTEGFPPDSAADEAGPRSPPASQSGPDGPPFHPIAGASPAVGLGEFTRQANIVPGSHTSGEVDVPVRMGGTLAPGLRFCQGE